MTLTDYPMVYLDSPLRQRRRPSRLQRFASRALTLFIVGCFAGSLYLLAGWAWEMLAGL